MKRKEIFRRIWNKSLPEEALRNEIEEIRRTLSPVDEAIRTPRGLDAEHIVRLGKTLSEPEKKETASRPRFTRSQWNRVVTLTATAAVVALTALTARNALLPAPNPVIGGLSPVSSPGSMTAESETTSFDAVTSAVESKHTAVSSAPVISAGGYEAVYLALAKMRDAMYTPGTPQSKTTQSKSNTVSGTAGSPKPTAPSGNNDKGDAPQIEDEYGGTNNQVEGVEEADILQNDGKYLYYLNQSSAGSFLQIFSADGKGSIRLLSELSLEQSGATPSEMMLYQNRLALVYTSGYYNTFISKPQAGSGGAYIQQDILFSRPATTVEIYDITDRTKPVLARTYQQDGRYVSSRLIGRDFYLATSMVSYGLDSLTRENVKDFLPNIKDSSNAGYEIPPSQISILPEAKTPQFVIVSGLKIDSDKAPDAESILGGGEQVYCSQSRLYLAGTSYTSAEIQSYIYAFQLKNGQVGFHAKGSVPGWILNQFSMDESGGYFRIATTANTINGTSNNLYILDSGLQITGSLLGLAPGENIKSARYIGDKAYVVTFRRTDPLFVIDLKNPKAPKLMGELKIPGFSSYLHPIGDGLLLGVGRDGDERGDYGTKLSIFDVTNPTSPKEIQKISVGTRSTELNMDSHKAVRYIASRSLVCVPVLDYTESHTVSEMLIYHVSAKKGFTLKARLTGDIPYPGTSAANRQFYCQYATMMNRTTFIGKTLYAFSPRVVLSVDLDSFSKIGGLVLKHIPTEDSFANRHSFFTSPELIYHEGK